MAKRIDPFYCETDAYCGRKLGRGFYCYDYDKSSKNTEAMCLPYDDEDVTYNSSHPLAHPQCETDSDCHVHASDAVCTPFPRHNPFLSVCVRGGSDALYDDVENGNGNPITSLDNVTQNSSNANANSNVNAGVNATANSNSGVNSNGVNYRVVKGMSREEIIAYSCPEAKEMRGFDRSMHLRARGGQCCSGAERETCGDAKLGDFCIRADTGEIESCWHDAATREKVWDTYTATRAASESYFGEFGGESVLGMKTVRVNDDAASTGDDILLRGCATAKNVKGPVPNLHRRLVSESCCRDIPEFCLAQGFEKGDFCVDQNEIRSCWKHPDTGAWTFAAYTDKDDMETGIIPPRD